MISDEPIYPHLKTLIHFDTREFFNVLALVSGRLDMSQFLINN